jgi:hypothetical protein
MASPGRGVAMKGPAFVGNDAAAGALKRNAENRRYAPAMAVPIVTPGAGRLL